MVNQGNHPKMALIQVSELNKNSQTMMTRNEHDDGGDNHTTMIALVYTEVEKPPEPPPPEKPPTPEKKPEAMEGQLGTIFLISNTLHHEVL